MNERLIEKEMEKQETPTLEEVKEYFKDAKEIKDFEGDISDLDKVSERGIHCWNGAYFVEKHVANNVYVWNIEHGYAEIVSYKKPKIEEIIDIIKKHDMPNPDLVQCGDVVFNKEEIEIISENFKPKQYAHGIDTFARAEANMTFEEVTGFVKGNIDKYNWRDKKQDREDLVKIIDYCNFGIKQIDNDANRRNETL